LIIPQLAKYFEGKLSFRVIGDGGLKSILEKQLLFLQCSNVEIVSPIHRDQLIAEYMQADILFLHLNNYNAFKKVLPSKIFEYAAIGLPIWAGVSGYAAEFIKKEIINSVVFQPCDVNDAIRSLNLLEIKKANRNEFIQKYSRTNIMMDMANNIKTFMEATQSPK